MRACKPRHKEPPARSLMWATAAQPGPRWLSGTQSRGRVFGNQLSWRWQEEERITTVRSGSHRGRDSGGELRAGWVRGKGRVVPWCGGGPHHCYGTAPLLLREPTLYYARHRQAIHTPAQLLLCSTAIREGVLPALSNVCKSSKIAGQPKFGGSSFRRRPIKGVADLGSALLSSSSSDKLTAPVLSCWHFLVLVCWSMHACAFWAGCWDHASNSSSTIRSARSHALPVTDSPLFPKNNVMT